MPPSGCVVYANRVFTTVESDAGEGGPPRGPLESPNRSKPVLSANSSTPAQSSSDEQFTTWFARGRLRLREIRRHLASTRFRTPKLLLTLGYSGVIFRA